MSEFAGIVQDELRDLRGRAMVGAVAVVRNVGTTTPATVYNNPVEIASAGGGDALVNDGTTGLVAAGGLLLPGLDANGNYTFFADSDLEYDLHVTWLGQVFDYRVRPKVVHGGAGGGVAPLAQATRLAHFFDDFDRSDRILNGDTAPGGQEWFVTGTGIASAAITNGRLTGPSNFYAVLGGGSAVRRVAGTFSFGAGSGTDRTYPPLTIAADKGQGTLANMLHLNFGPDGWSLTKRLSAGAFTEIAAGVHTLLTDGTIYGLSMDIDAVAGTVVVTPPMGPKVSVTHADITTIAPLYGWIQYQGDGGSNVGYKGFWHSFTTGPSVAPALRAEGGGASSADLALLYGSDYTRRQRIAGVLTGGSGWYRIASQVIASSFIIAGRVVISATDQGQTGAIGRRTFAEVDAATNHGAVVAPRLGQRFADELFPAISQVRLSRDDTAFLIGLDVFKAGADPMRYSIEFFGAFLPIGAPVIGATALATASTVLALNPASVVNLSQQPANADTSGATLAALETEVNQLKALLRTVGLLTP